jgi:serine/threonine protein kinase
MGSSRALRLRLTGNRVEVPTLPTEQRVVLHLGAFELREHLAMGSVGVIFEALQSVDGEEPVVVSLHIPFVRHQQDRNFQEEYIATTAALRTINHPNLVNVQDAGCDGVVWRVMERLGGWTMANVQRRARARAMEVPPGGVVHVLRTAAEGLTALHRHGRVHGRITANRILALPSGNIKVSGWMSPELAETPAHLTNNSVALADLAPEQLMGMPVDARTDVYRLALMGAALLCGGNPLLRLTSEQVRGAVLSEAPLLPESTPAPLRDLLRQALDKRPENRPQTMQAFLTALECLPTAPLSQAEWRIWLSSLFQGISILAAAGRQSEAISEAAALRAYVDSAQNEPDRRVARPSLPSAPSMTVAAPSMEPSPFMKAYASVADVAAPLERTEETAEAPISLDSFRKEEPKVEEPPRKELRRPDARRSLFMDVAPPSLRRTDPPARATAPPVPGPSLDAEVTWIQPPSQTPARRNAEPVRSAEPKAVQLRRESTPQRVAPRQRSRMIEVISGAIGVVLLCAAVVWYLNAQMVAARPTGDMVDPSAFDATPATVTPSVVASVAAAAPASTLADLKVGVEADKLVLRGMITGAGQPAVGFLTEDGESCEYKLRMKNTGSALDFSKIVVASALAQQVTVAEAGGSTTVTVSCSAGQVLPQLTANATDFELVLRQL